MYTDGVIPLRRLIAFAATSPSLRYKEEGVMRLFFSNAEAKERWRRGGSTGLQERRCLETVKAYEDVDHAAIGQNDIVIYRV